MELNVIIDDEIYTLNVPAELVQQAAEFFDRMDKDMDEGWQMSRDWVENPTLVQRLQIVGDKLLTALENENHDLGRMMAAYILNTEVRFSARDSALSFASAGDQFSEMPEAEARAEAERQVSDVYKVGRHFAFSVMNPESGAWETVTTGKGEQEARNRRREILLQRYNALATRQ